VETVDDAAVPTLEAADDSCPPVPPTPPPAAPAADDADADADADAAPVLRRGDPTLLGLAFHSDTTAPPMAPWMGGMDELPATADNDDDDDVDDEGDDDDDEGEPSCCGSCCW
jgi:hypothetical protein